MYVLLFIYMHIYQIVYIYCASQYCCWASEEELRCDNRETIQAISNPFPYHFILCVDH